MLIDAFSRMAGGIDAAVKVPYGSYQDVLKTKDTTPLEPGLVEHKYYATGVGLVLTVDREAGGPGAGRCEAELVNAAVLLAPYLLALPFVVA